MKNMSKMLKQLQEAQSQMMQVQEQLASQTVEGSAGGGMVKVVANGRHELQSIKIDPSVVDPADVEMLEDLITAALNDARTRADEMIKGEMGKLTGGFGIPGLM